MSQGVFTVYGKINGGNTESAYAITEGRQTAQVARVGQGVFTVQGKWSAYAITEGRLTLQVAFKVFTV